MAELAPFRVEPRFTARVWGTCDLRPWYDCVAEGEPIGEVWLTGDDCVIATGPHKGEKLGAMFAEAQEAMVGAGAPGAGVAAADQSDFRQRKAECAGASRRQNGAEIRRAARQDGVLVRAGGRAGSAGGSGAETRHHTEQIEEEIQAGTLEASLNAVPVAAGDMIFVDAGTIHAIWPGSILLETQQNSDTTYRLFDYGRGRELHIEKSLEATKLTTRAGKIAPQKLADRTVLIDVGYFRVERVPLEGSRTSESLSGGEKPGLAYLFAAAGSGRLTGSGFEPVELPARGIVAVPAASPRFVLEDVNAGRKLDLIRITPNWPG